MMKTGYAAIILLVLGSGSRLFSQFQDDVGISFHGAGWIQASRITNVTDTIADLNYNGNVMQNTGALFNGLVKFDNEFEGEFGIGAVKGHSPLGNLSNYSFYEGWQTTFLNMARVTYTMGGDAATTPLMLTSGLFSYKYDNDVRNFGLYLLRGSVYPAFLFSGFETKEMLPSANLLGFHMRNNFGEMFTQDVLITSETDLKPLFDISLAYIATVKLGGYLELGAGVNLYHYLAKDGNVTNPTEEFYNRGAVESDPYFADSTTFARMFVFDDINPIMGVAADGSDSVTGYDTTTFVPSHKGIKTMARMVFDPKPLLGIDLWHPSDLKIYTEAALIGITGPEEVYGPLSSRIPVMFGIYIPTWFFDEFTLEIEYFGSQYNPDTKKLIENGSPIPRGTTVKRSGPYDPAVPKTFPYDTEADNIKWSLYWAKVFAGHVKVSGQFAADHTQLGTTKPVFKSYNESFSTLDDWYTVLKLTFFF